MEKEELLKSFKEDILMADTELRVGEWLSDFDDVVLMYTCRFPELKDEFIEATKDVAWERYG